MVASGIELAPGGNAQAGYGWDVMLFVELDVLGLHIVPIE